MWEYVASDLGRLFFTDAQVCSTTLPLCSGTDISTSPLAPASEFLKKGLSDKYILVFTCQNGHADFPEQ